MRLVPPVERRYLPVLVLAALALLPFLSGRFSFHLDFVRGPAWRPVGQTAFGFRTPAYGGALPLLSWLSRWVDVVGAGLVQKLIFVGLVVVLGLVWYPTLGGTAKLYAATLFLLSPFVYARLVVGHWVLLLGLAALPAVLLTFSAYLDRGGTRNLLLAVLAVTVLGFSAHLLLASVVLLGSLVLFRTIETRSGEPLRRTAGLAAVTVPLNAYWLGPVLLADGPALGNVAASDVVTFAPEIDAVTALFSVATMHGFWRGGIVYAKDVFPPVIALYAVILFLAVYGFVTNHDHPERGYVVRAVAATAVVALLLGAGVNGPAAPAFRWAFEHVPFFAGMRDSQKFVALLVLAYAYLGALGLGELAEDLRSLDLGTLNRPEIDLGRLHLPTKRYDRAQLLTAAVVVLAVLTPVAYTFPMVTGYADQVNSQDYPREWYEVEAYLDDQPDDGAVLFLPWHQYMDYDWLESDRKRIATPARVFFERPVVQGDNVEAGPTYSTSTNPVSRYVEFLFGLGPDHEPEPVDNMGELLTHVDVQYVLVTKQADWRDYDAVLRNQSDLTLAMENDEFRVYRNEHDAARAYATNEVTYVEDWDDFVNRSRTEDTTESVYVVDEARAGEVETLPGAGSDRQPVNATAVHPAKYALDGTTNAYTVFTQRQATYADTWRYDGAEPAYRHLGISPVFRSDGDGATVTYATFYRVYLPSYLVSLLSLLALVGLVVRDGRLDSLRIRGRLPGR